MGSGQIAINVGANGVLHADTAGATLAVDVYNTTTPTFTNTGQLRASNGGTLRFSDGFTNDGIIHAGTSSLIDVNTLFTNGAAGSIRGTGTFEVSGILTNNGRIAPGDLTGSTAGTLNVNLPGSGTFAFNPSSVFDVDLAGASSGDRLVVNGRATLGGTLAVRLIDGYLPSAATSFTILTATNPSTGSPPTPALGTFANAANGATIRSADNRATFVVTYASNNQVGLSGFALVGDFDADNDLDAADIDQLLRATSGSVPPALAKFDVNFNNAVAAAHNAANSDSAHWVTYLKGTHFGDANLNGAVDFDDLLLLAQNYGNTNNATGWSLGNFDGSGGVTFDDLLLLAANYGQGTANLTPAAFAADWAAAQAIVPEPATLALAAGGLLLARRRRR